MGLGFMGFRVYGLVGFYGLRVGVWGLGLRVPQAPKAGLQISEAGRPLLMLRLPSNSLSPELYQNEPSLMFPLYSQSSTGIAVPPIILPIKDCC